MAKCVAEFSDRNLSDATLDEAAKCYQGRPWNVPDDFKAQKGLDWIREILASLIRTQRKIWIPCCFL